MPRSLHRGSSAGASGSATSGVTTRHCGALSSASPCSSCTLSLRGGLPGPGRRGAGAAGSALGRLLHARGGRVLLAGGAEASASSGGVCSCGGDAAAISGELRGGSAVSGGWGLGGGHGGEGEGRKEISRRAAR